MSPPILVVETFETDVTGFSGRRQLLDAALAASRRCKLSAEEEAATVLIGAGILCMLFAGYKADLMIDTRVWPEFRVDGTHSLKLANHIFIGCGLMRAPGRICWVPITAEEEIWDTGGATLMVHMTSHGVTSWLIPQEQTSLDLFSQC